MPDPPYGLVAYGGGAGFIRTLPYLALKELRLATIQYVGDIDLPGIAIAVSSSKQAVFEGLPPITAAPGFHAAMLAAAKTLGCPGGWPAEASIPLLKDEELVKFYPDAIRLEILALLRNRCRIPEEVIGLYEMAAILEAIQTL